ncbi:hypothetical protein EV644_101961 [Kribbella orskensis]|uniref:Uncharacterized protein n=1 Tax=Kribbella orskensis TaxID=2512216 RepID=A0ABY2BVQ7_9ACTN|nr:hypothetical protein [Kribbella orskensis]TCO32317.1 hypothetical protein EV644_101961 [Kribbella orskensis]
MPDYAGVLAFRDNNLALVRERYEHWNTEHWNTEHWTSPPAPWNPANPPKTRSSANSTKKPASSSPPTSRP